MDFNIKDYLKKFIGITPPDDFLKERLVDEIKKHIRIDIKKTNIHISSGIAYIKTNPLIKNEIFMKKEKILISMSEDFFKKIIDIR